jgi:hypothetical protein
MVRWPIKVPESGPQHLARTHRCAKDIGLEEVSGRAVSELQGNCARRRQILR